MPTAPGRRDDGRTDLVGAPGDQPTAEPRDRFVSRGVSTIHVRFNSDHPVRVRTSVSLRFLPLSLVKRAKWVSVWLSELICTWDDQCSRLSMDRKGKFGFAFNLEC